MYIKWQIIAWSYPQCSKGIKHFPNSFQKYQWLTKTLWRYTFNIHTFWYSSSVGLCFCNHSLIGRSLNDPVTPQDTCIFLRVSDSVTSSTIPRKVQMSHCTTAFVIWKVLTLNFSSLFIFCKFLDLKFPNFLLISIFESM